MVNVSQGTLFSCSQASLQILASLKIHQQDNNDRAPQAGYETGISDNAIRSAMLSWKENWLLFFSLPWCNKTLSPAPVNTYTGQNEAINNDFHYNILPEETECQKRKFHVTSLILGSPSCNPLTCILEQIHIVHFYKNYQFWCIVHLMVNVIIQTTQRETLHLLIHSILLYYSTTSKARLIHQIWPNFLFTIHP